LEQCEASGRIGRRLCLDHRQDIGGDSVARVLADHRIPVGTGECARAQAGQVKHRAGLYVHTQSAILVDVDTRCGVNGDRVGCGLDRVGRESGGVCASLEPRCASQGEVFPGRDFGDAVVVEEAGDNDSFLRIVQRVAKYLEGSRK
jgi:hypothetical protein